VAVLALAALLAAGAQSITRRTFMLHAPNATWLAVLRPTSRVCEGPVVARDPTQSAGIWGAAGPGHPAQLTVEVQDAATHKVLGSAPVAAPAVEAQATARFPHALPAGVPLRICLTQDSGTFALYGSPAQNPGVIMTGKLLGTQPTSGKGEEFSLNLYSTDNHSLLDSLGLAFSRAALWRPSWVGPWTFWVLAIALLGTFGLGVAATVAAATDDEEPDQGVRDVEDTPPPPPNPSDESSPPRVALR
jgi:hypothetical protein